MVKEEGKEKKSIIKHNKVLTNAKKYGKTLKNNM